MRPAAVTAGIGTVLLVAAALFDAESLYVPGTAFVLLGAAAAAWVHAGTAGLRVERALTALTVMEDQPVDVRLVVRAGLTPLPTGVLEDDLLPAPVPLALGERTMALRIHASFARRGPRTLAPPRVVVRDPFSLASRSVTAGPPVELLVLPRIHPVTAPPGAADGSILSPRAGRPRMAAEFELDGLRPHRPGSPASRIHWSVFARTDELWERKLLADADSRPLVVLDPRCAEGDAGQDGLDAAVRAVASLAVALAGQGGCGLLLPGDRRPFALEAGLTGWPRAHVRLAHVRDQGPPSSSGLAGRAGPVVYVSARPVTRTPRALQGGSGGLRILVVPGPQPAGRRALFAVAGCTGYALRESRQEAA